MKILGTFFLCFVGIGSICQSWLLKETVNEITPRLNICLSFGIAVAGGIYIGVNVSGGHINPAVTIGASMKRILWTNIILIHYISHMIWAISYDSYLYRARRSPKIWLLWHIIKQMQFWDDLVVTQKKMPKCSFYILFHKLLELSLAQLLFTSYIPTRRALLKTTFPKVTILRNHSS